MSDVEHRVDRLVRQFKRIKTWQLVVLFILTSFITATFLRLNNVGMVERREAVLAADREARDGDVRDRLLDLQHYVAAHMNTDTGQFDRTEQYNRDYEAALEAVMDDANPNGNIYAKAEALCRQRYPDYRAGSYAAYQQCFLSEIDKYPPAPNPSDNFTPPIKEDYRASYVGPRWSPDFAGFSLLISIVLGLIIIGRWLQIILLYVLLKLRRKGIWS